VTYKREKEGLMKCALCGKEIKGRDYINASTHEKEIYVHSMPCDWYDFKKDTDNNA
jgi:ribosomal protein L37AE/L43A